MDIHDPANSYGHGVIEFADKVLGKPLDPWQQEIALRIGEMLPDGRPRFRVALIIVARQNGKTWLATVLSLYWLFVTEVSLILGMSTNLDVAKEPWRAVCDMAESNPWLKPSVKRIGKGKGSEEFELRSGGRYKIAASNGQGGRGLSIDRLILDELREQRTFDAWNSAEPTTSARWGSQIIAITNQGDEGAVVLDSLRLPAIEFIKTGEGDPRLGLFEYSAPQGMAADDVQAMAYANPNMGRRLDPDTLIASARRAVKAGGEELAGFRTEKLCQRVELLDPAIDPDAWEKCGAGRPLRINNGGYALTMCLDTSMDGTHSTLVASAVVTGVVRVQVVKTWSGVGHTEEIRRDLPRLCNVEGLRAFGWFADGPTAALGADLMQHRRTRNWPPSHCEVSEISGAHKTRACMGFSEQVLTGAIEHGRDPELTAHVGATARRPMGDGYVFDRRGSHSIDGAYAAAGAVHLARLLPVRAPLRAL